MTIAAPIPPTAPPAAAAPEGAAPRPEVTVIDLAPRAEGLARRAFRRVVRGCRAIGWRRRLAAFGPGSVIDRPAWITGGAAIEVGAGVRIWRGARIEAHETSGGGKSAAIRIRIGDGSAIHPFAHIAAVREVEIGAGALLASNVYVTDHDHDFACPETPPVSNRRVVAAPTRIGDFAWLGEGVKVLRGVTIGAHAVIGAGSVVTRDIPPHSVAVGAPARVVRRYDVAAGAWREGAAS